MFTLTADTIALHAHATDKMDAIRQAGELLVKGGIVLPAYVDGMLGREKTMSTNTGVGVAIPHGRPKNMPHILKTGISVLQLAEEVKWKRGEEKVSIVIGIAALGDEHLRVMTNLCEVIEDEAKLAELIQTGDPQVVMDYLNGVKQPAAAASVDEPARAPEGPAVHRAELVITFQAGLHARPAKVLVTLAKKFKADLRLECNQKRVNAKAMVSVLTLGATCGSTLIIEASGEDAELALASLAMAVREGLGEADLAPVAAAGKPAPRPVPVPAEPDLPGILRGVGAAPGIAVGPVFQYRSSEISLDRLDAPCANGLGLDEALAQARHELTAEHRKLTAKKMAAEAAIFEAQGEFLEDTDFIETVRARMAGGASAARAWHATVAEGAAELAAVPDPLLAARAADLRDVGRRVLGLLLGIADLNPVLPETPVVIVARDLSPSVTANFDPQRVLGFVIVDGGPTSHIAILARGLGLPAIVGADPAIMALPDRTRVIMDGSEGCLDTAPDPEAFQQAAQAQQHARERRQLALEQAELPSATLDGRKVDVTGNAGSLDNAVEAMKLSADGIGLLRTEFLFLDRGLAPDEDEQYRVYRGIAETMGRRPVIVRTLDIGGDKPVAYLPMPAEDNPFLGVRGIRLCLRQPELFREQLRAILRAASHGNLQIMFPMVSDLSELRQARALVEEERRSLGAPEIKLGIMIEVPSAALLADKLAPEVDFFSIGTNDLTQYTLAMDRGNKELGKRQDGLHPAVLRLISHTVTAAHQHGKRVDICGELGSDAAAIPILVGLGLDELSVSIKAIPTVKAQVRGLALAAVQPLAQQALDCSSAVEVRELVKNFNARA